MTLRSPATLITLALLFVLYAATGANARVVSATGVAHLDGRTVHVDVVVAVAPGQSDRQATEQALAEQGARPLAGKPAGGEQYFYNGLVWDPPSVVQHYNPANQPFAAKGALLDTYADWSNIPGSAYSISSGADTSRCPSLVRECRGPQTLDGFNDVAWLRLGGSSTLAVTWYTTSPTEADMAINTRFTWSTWVANVCGGTGPGYDAETVFLHENGHVAGLDHVNRTDSVMYPVYQGPRCTLYPYDERAMANLY